MYLRPEVIVSDWSAVERFLRTHALGLLTTAIPHAGQSTIQASHLPFHFVPPSSPPQTIQETSSASLSSNSILGTWNCSANQDLGLLRCHLARANPQAKALLAYFEQHESEEVLIVFTDPHNDDGYITPQWYIETKPSTAKTVPTWNYSELQVYGSIHPLPREGLSRLIRDLSNTHEQSYVDKVGKNETWKVEDAPEKYIDLLERAIVGFEVRVTKVGFKCKMSREKGEGDRQGVIDGLRSVGQNELAELTERLGPMKKTSS
ncbi:Transcriptional regulator PAI 2-type [Kalmanozyma brasiliensis GHG001]|uniref:Transcriptional regulator n=1 Tax=Kalmanozyma brasiliensis (strain GHG001) TaxID=1365824 RepID=V5EWA9_KALBG|nr:Transcriptional regulator PAI 2-type [Kalmanozyma brasiliensis GHG001]EST09850.1 Transcriptional regulator PAI 2-type [Kalmanozyma brasiliensis GHG001]